MHPEAAERRQRLADVARQRHDEIGGGENGRQPEKTWQPQHDATLACWDSKYTFLELRPSQADSTITPLFANPQHPAFQLSPLTRARVDAYLEGARNGREEK